MGTLPLEAGEPGLFERLRTQLDDPSFNMWSFGSTGGPNSFEPIEKLVPTVTVLNLKGGVGKTTLAMNYGAFLAREKKKKVLFVDMDYQGSLTNTFRRAWVAATQRDVPAHGFARGAPGFWLYSGTSSEQLVADAFDIHSVVPGSYLLEADYPLFDIENRTYLQWALRSATDDVRLRLARLIHTATLQHSVDVVVIDAPPRLSLGAMNALAASTHFVIPTVLDILSIEPIRMLLTQLRELFPEHILPQFSGVVPCQTSGKTLTTYEGRMRRALERTLAASGYEGGVFASHIPDKADISKLAGQRVGFMSSKIVREVMAPACGELWTRMASRPTMASGFRLVEAA